MNKLQALAVSALPPAAAHGMIEVRVILYDGPSSRLTSIRAFAQQPLAFGAGADLELEPLKALA